MRKTLVITLAVAILGIVSLYAHKRDNATPITATTPKSTSVLSTTANSGSSTYHDGTYSGSDVQTLYGEVEVQAIISGGNITDIQFLKMPDEHGHSSEITSMAAPILKQETLDAQSSNIDFVSGATSTFDGYKQSLQAALDKAAGA